MDADEDLAGEQPDEVDGNSDYVTFDMAGERYAFPVRRVREIIRMPAVVKVPLGPPSLEGLANLRGRVLPVVSLRRCCTTDQTGPARTTRVIVVDSGVPLGFVVDRVAGVISIDPRQVVPAEPVPSTVRPDVRVGVFKSGGGEVTTVLDVDDLTGSQFARLSEKRAGRDAPVVARMSTEADVDTGLGDALVQEAGNEIAEYRWGDELDMADERASVDDGRGDEDLFVVFRLGDEEYAVDVDAVQEVIRVPERLVRVPRAGDFVDGVADLRGTVLLVVDLRTRLGLGRCERDRRQRVVVLASGGVRAGFVVDSVAEVARIGRKAVEAAPMPSAEQAGVVLRVANLSEGQRMLLLVQVDRLLAADQAGPAAELREVVCDEALAAV